MIKLVITGGHHTPAIAVITALREKCQMSNVKCQIFWIGHKYSMKGDRTPSVEYQSITKRGIPFYNLQAGKVYRVRDPLMWLRVPWGFLQALWYLVRIRPHLIISFGGYLAAPVVLAGWLLRIPSVTHEQTVITGLANRLISHFAKKIFITWEESRAFFPASKTILTGNPIRKEIFDKFSIFNFQFSNERNTVYITGGKQGSRIINEAVKGALPELLKHFNVIHQCGSRDYEEMGDGYMVKDYFDESEIGAVYAAADFVVSRSGANTVYELAALGKPAILIPIPWVSYNEQERNARILVNAGAATILPQDQLTSSSLIHRCIEMGENLEKFREGGKRAQKLVRLDAAERMAEEIINLITS